MLEPVLTSNLEVPAESNIDIIGVDTPVICFIPNLTVPTQLVSHGIIVSTSVVVGINTEVEPTAP